MNPDKYAARALRLEADALEARARELRATAAAREVRMATRFEERLAQALALPRRTEGGFHPAAFDDTRMSTEALDAWDRERASEISISFNRSQATALAATVRDLRSALTDYSAAARADHPADLVEVLAAAATILHRFDNIEFGWKR